ncbi:hypothetical protein I4U23_025646 [Adineta vaga]|nr:hypothetical protein I4U23_025646 [Adineta vaga]
MTTLKPLFQSECGTTNPLIKLTEFYTYDQTLVTQDSIINSSTSPINSIDDKSVADTSTMVDQLVNEYYRPTPAPNTFQLQNLLTNLYSSDTNKCEWTKQFLDPYFTSTQPNSTITEPMISPQLFDHKQNYIPSMTSPILHSHSIFLDQQLFLTQTEPDNDTVNAANNILSFLGESQFAVKTESETITENLNTKLSTIDINGKQESKLYQLDSHFSHNLDYKFIQQNPFLDIIDSYEEGLKRLEVHDILNAILCFEAAVQKDSKHIDAWLQLGISQHKSEQDNRAICALKKCVEIDSKNLQAYSTLAACYANEMFKNEALDSLYNWLKNHNRYSRILSDHQLHSINNNETRITDELTFEKLKNFFLQAISLSDSPNEIDSDLEVCLGILLYIYEDYTKAAECFNIAVLTKPNVCSDLKHFLFHIQNQVVNS